MLQNTIRANDGGELLNSAQFQYIKNEDGQNVLNLANPVRLEGGVQVRLEDGLTSNNIYTAKRDATNVNVFTEGYVVSLGGTDDDGVYMCSATVPFSFQITTSDSKTKRSYGIQLVPAKDQAGTQATGYHVQRVNSITMFSPSNKRFVLTVSDEGELVVTPK